MKHAIGQPRLAISEVGKGRVRSQFSALCYRLEGTRPEILLITSRGTGRWILPKGWPMDGRTPAEAAAQEAWEEAGVIGRAHDLCLGVYCYDKSVGRRTSWPCAALIYPVEVRKLVREFPERGQRRRKWFSPAKAAKRVNRPDLGAILREFDPRVLH